MGIRDFAKSARPGSGRRFPLTNADTLTGKGGQPVTPAKLYNLATDIGETKDLASTEPDKVKELQAKWDAWNTANVKPLWGNGSGDNDGDEPGAAPRKKKAKQE